MSVADVAKAMHTFAPFCTVAGAAVVFADTAPVRSEASVCQ